MEKIAIIPTEVTKLKGWYGSRPRVLNALIHPLFDLIKTHNAVDKDTPSVLLSSVNARMDTSWPSKVESLYYRNLANLISNLPVLMLAEQEGKIQVTAAVLRKLGFQGEFIGYETQESNPKHHKTDDFSPPANLILHSSITQIHISGQYLETYKLHQLPQLPWIANLVDWDKMTTNMNLIRCVGAFTRGVGKLVSSADTVINITPVTYLDTISRS